MALITFHGLSDFFMVVNALRWHNGWHPGWADVRFFLSSSRLFRKTECLIIWKERDSIQISRNHPSGSDFFSPDGKLLPTLTIPLMRRKICYHGGKRNTQCTEVCRNPIRRREQVIRKLFHQQNPLQSGRQVSFPSDL